MQTMTERRMLPTTRNAITHKFSVGGHEGYLTIGLYDDGSPGEVFIKMAKEGSTIKGMVQAYCRALSLALTGEETVDIGGIAETIKPRMDIPCTIHRPDGSSEAVALLCRIDTEDEVAYYKNGGILSYVLRNLKAA